MTEQWKPIPRFPGYDISSHGNIRSYHTSGDGKRWHIANRPQRYLRQHSNKNGYLTITLCVVGKQYSCHIAHLVMLAFVGPRPIGLDVCHSDSNKANNCLDNLRYDTVQGNMADRSYEARYAPRNNKLTDAQVVELRERFAASRTISSAALAKEYGISRSTIYQICAGQRRSHLGGPLTKRRLSDVLVRTIVKRLEHETVRDLADEYGIDKETIYRWRRGQCRMEAMNG